jgi:hypothetical protein
MLTSGHVRDVVAPGEAGPEQEHAGGAAGILWTTPESGATRFTINNSGTFLRDDL